MFRAPADLVQFGDHPIEVDVRLPLTEHVAGRLDDQHGIGESRKAIHERFGGGDVMERIEHRDKVDRARRFKGLSRTLVEGHVGQCEAIRVAARSIDGRRAVVESGKRRVGPPAREFAGDLSGAAADVEHVAAGGDMRLGKIGEAADRNVTRIGEAERKVVRSRERLVVELLVRSARPRGASPAQVPRDSEQRLEHARGSHQQCAHPLLQAGVCHADDYPPTGPEAFLTP